MTMNVSLELAVLLALSNVGMIVFGAFEAETARWRKLLKWTLLHATTIGVSVWVGHWALLAPAALGGVGVGVHVWWCAKHRIHPLHATPRDRYYELRGWTWPPV